MDSNPENNYAEVDATFHPTRGEADPLVRLTPDEGVQGYIYVLTLTCILFFAVAFSSASNRPANAST
jgi:hypothetical protein